MFVKMLPPLGEMSQAVEQLLSQEVLVSQEECQTVERELCLGVYTVPCSPAALQMLSANLT